MVNLQTASATADLEYNMGNLIAIMLPEPGGGFAENSIFGRTRIPQGKSKYSESNQSKIFQDLISDDLADASSDSNRNRHLDFWIHGLVFSNDSKLASLSISTSDPGTINSHAIKMSNLETGDDVECDIEVRFRRVTWNNSLTIDQNVQRVRLDQPLVNFNQDFYQSNGIASIVIRGQVHPRSVTVQDRPGRYIGNLSISISNI